MRKQKDRAIRDKHERRLLIDLDKLHARIGAGRLVGELNIGEAIGRLKERYPCVARYYDIAFDPDAQTLRYSLNEPRRELAERLDGSYVLKSDRTDLGADEAWRIYHLLTRAENAFRCMKSLLAERPIFHQVQRCVETHIFLCVLAYRVCQGERARALRLPASRVYRICSPRAQSLADIEALLPTRLDPAALARDSLQGLFPRRT